MSEDTYVSTSGSGDDDSESDNVALGLGLSIGLYVLVCVLVPVLIYIMVEIFKADPCNLGICPRQSAKKPAERTVSVELGLREADYPPLYPMKDQLNPPANTTPHPVQFNPPTSTTNGAPHPTITVTSSSITKAHGAESSPMTSPTTSVTEHDS